MSRGMRVGEVGGVCDSLPLLLPVRTPEFLLLISESGSTSSVELVTALAGGRWESARTHVSETHPLCLLGKDKEKPEKEAMFPEREREGEQCDPGTDSSYRGEQGRELWRPGTIHTFPGTWQSALRDECRMDGRAGGWMDE